MTTSTLVVSRRPSRIVAFGIVGFAVTLALASQVAVSMILYLLAGAAGLPVFSPFGAPGLARFVGPTGGYLFAYPVAAFVAGTLSRRARSLLGRWVAALAGATVLLLGGLAQLAILTGGLSQALPLAFHPFVPLDAVKALVAALLGPKSTRAPV